MRVCLLKVIIKEINYLDQPKPHQGLAKQLHTVPVVAQRCTVAQHWCPQHGRGPDQSAMVHASGKLLGYPLPGELAKLDRIY